MNHKFIYFLFSFFIYLKISIIIFLLYHEASEYYNKYYLYKSILSISNNYNIYSKFLNKLSSYKIHGRYLLV